MLGGVRDVQRAEDDLLLGGRGEVLQSLVGSEVLRRCDEYRVQSALDRFPLGRVLGLTLARLKVVDRRHRVVVTLVPAMPLSSPKMSVSSQSAAASKAESLLLLDQVPMSLAEETHDVARSIDNHGEQAGNVSPEHAHVERFSLGHGRISAVKRDSASVITTEADPSLNNNRVGQPSDAADAIMGGDRRETKQHPDRCTEYGAIGASINQKLGSYPRTIVRQDLGPDHRADDPIVAQ